MEIKIIKSKRKTISIQVVSSEELVVRAPKRVSKKTIDETIAKHELWIEKQQEKKRREEIIARNITPLSDIEVDELADKAVQVFVAKVEHYAPIVGVTYGRITIRNQKTRWGSCSAKGNLNFNVALMRAPIEVLDYIVVPELCHRRHLDHSREFWDDVEKVIPDYRIYEKWLKDNGNRIMREVGIL
jgi:predicted metal-dependent hydrolase